MRRVIALLVFAALTQNLSSDEWIPTVAFVGVRAAEIGLDSTAEQIESSLRVRLINSREATIVDTAFVHRTLAELGLDEVSDPADARRLAGALDADFVLSGVARRLEGTVAVSLEMRTRSTGEISIAAEEVLEGGRDRSAVDRLSRAVGDALTTARRIELSDIALLGELGELKEALRLLSIYEEGREDHPSAASLRDALEGTLAKRAFDESRRLTQLYLFDEAILRVNTALYYEPDNELYKGEIERIETRRKEFETVQAAKILRQAELLVLSEHYDSAAALLSIAAERDADRNEVDRLTQLVTDGRWEQELHMEALEAFWRGDYTVARAKATQAVILAPDKMTHRELLDRIERHAREADSVEDTWAAYLASLHSLDAKQLFGLRKPTAEGFRLRLGRSTVTWRDRLSLDQPSMLLWNLAVANDWGRTLYREVGFPFVGLEFVYGPAMSLSWGWEEVIGELLVINAPFAFDIGGECSIRVTLFSFALDLGVAGRLGYFRWKETKRDLETGLQEASVSNAFSTAGAGVFRLDWTINDRFSVGYESMRDLGAFYSDFPDEDWERLRFERAGIWVRRRW